MTDTSKIDPNVGVVNVFIAGDGNILDMLEFEGGGDMAMWVKCERDLRIRMCQILSDAIEMCADGLDAEEVTLFYQNKLHEIGSDTEFWAKFHGAAKAIDQLRFGPNT